MRRLLVSFFGLVLLGCAISLPDIGRCQEPPQPEQAPAPSARALIVAIDHDAFEAERAKGVAEIDALNGELNVSYKKRDFEGLDRIVQRYRDKPYTMVWGKPTLEHIYAWLGTPAPEESLEQYEEWLNKWVAARPKSSTPRVLLADRYISWAWEARGSGVAGTVTDEGWQLFHERLRKAQAFLEEAEALEHPDPELYRLKIRVEKGLGGNRAVANAAVDAGIKLDPSYAALYTEMGAFLLPRWHGEYGDMESFAEGLSAKIGAELGAEMYMRIALDMMYYERAGFFEHTRFDYERILSGFVTFSKKYHSNVEIQNEVTYIACLQRDRELAARLLKPLNPDQMNLGTWWNAELAECWRKWIETKMEPRGAAVMFPADRVPLRTILFLPDSRRLVVFGNLNSDPLFMWDGDAGRLLGRLPHSESPTRTLDIAANRRNVVIAGGDLSEESIKLLLYNVEKEALVRVSSAPTSAVRGVALSRKGDEIAALQADQVISLWKPKDLDEQVAKLEVFEPEFDQELIDRYEANPDALNCNSLTYSGDDAKLLGVLDDHELRIWNVEDGKLEKRWCQEHGFAPCVSGVLRSRDGKYLAISYQAEPQRPLEIVDAVTFTPVCEVKHKSRVLYAVEMDDKSELLAIGGEVDGITIWNVKTGELAHRFELASSDTVTALSFSPDGKKLAAGVAAHPWDGTVYIWDISQLRAVKP